VDLDTTRQPRPRGAAGRPDDAGAPVTALYQAHGVGLIRLAVIMLGDRPAAEDVVQEAFCGLYRRWDHLDDPQNALRYVRSSVLNGCRSVLRNRGRLRPGPGSQPGRPDTVESAESTALVGEEHRAVLAALRRLPDRQREALVLRFYLDLSEAEIARSMGISQGTVKSTVSRALAALGRLLGEGS
jgi:RNA polymerase sigma-70 factor (sigma-E family)